MDEHTTASFNEMEQKRIALAKTWEGTSAPTIDELRQIAKKVLIDLMGFDETQAVDDTDIAYISNRMHAATQELDKYHLRMFSHQVTPG